MSDLDFHDAAQELNQIALSNGYSREITDKDMRFGLPLMRTTIPAGAVKYSRITPLSVQSWFSSGLRCKNVMVHLECFYYDPKNYEVHFGYTDYNIYPDLTVAVPPAPTFHRSHTSVKDFLRALKLHL